MSVDKIHKTYINTQTILQSADLITIASSPMFLDQTIALLALNHLFAWNTQRITD
jgi:hypothetical protein